VSNFEPTKLVVWLIFNTIYDKCRPVKDLPEVQESFDNIFKILISLGIKKEDIKKAYDSKKLYLEQKKELISDLKILETKPENSNDKLLLLVIYAGHGVIRQKNTNIMFNEERDSDRYEDLEGLLIKWTLSNKKNYTIALFDCCRDIISFPQPEPKTK
jgi:hypothetical protein